MYKPKQNKMTVFVKAEYLIEYTFQMTDNTNRYGKKHRFTFVDRIQNLSLDIYSKLIKSNQLPFSMRKEIQLDAIADMEVLIALIEISLNKEFIDDEQCERWASKVIDVKNLTGAWLKKSN